MTVGPCSPQTARTAVAPVRSLNPRSARVATATTSIRPSAASPIANAERPKLYIPVAESCSIIPVRHILTRYRCALLAAIPAASASSLSGTGPSAAAIETSNANTKDLLWKFVKKYKKNILEKDHPIFDKLIGYAIKYFNDIIKLNKKYKSPSKEETKALLALVNALENINDKMSPEDIQTLIYSVGKENGYTENLREWFKLIYEVVFGDENGPRMGFFISFFGVDETKQLIKDKLK